MCSGVNDDDGWVWMDVRVDKWMQVYDVDSHMHFVALADVVSWNAIWLEEMDGMM